MQTQSALIIVDMINDFIYGSMKLKKTNKIISNIQHLISWAHKSNTLVIYLNDAHQENDTEFKIWPKHAIANTYGSKIINELKVIKEDIVINKNTYNGFINTNLDSILKQNKINNLYVCGVQTDICIRELISTAYQLGYGVNILVDATKTKNNSIHKKTIKELNEIYNTKRIKTKELIKY